MTERERNSDKSGETKGEAMAMLGSGYSFQSLSISNSKFEWTPLLYVGSDVGLRHEVDRLGGGATRSEHGLRVEEDDWEILALGIESRGGWGSDKT